MPPQPKLKVYRTPIGFHDAYVAAPSQKAALQAWGSDSDLFAQKIAEQVTDPDLMKEALAHPGEIIRKLRGTAAEQVAALGSEAAKKAAKRPAKPKPKSKPSRAALAQAEHEVQELKSRQADEVEVIKREMTALAQKLKDAESAYVVELKAAETQLQDQAAQYEKALRVWEGN
jgi:hypothetical protein